jgi:outer membrane protein assembly factor BamA
VTTLRTLAPLVIALIACTPLAVTGQQQEPARDATSQQTDVADLWRAIRHKPPASADQPDEGKLMLVVAPVIGSNPSNGVTFGVAGQVAFYRGPTTTTSISSVVAGLTFSTKKQVLFNAGSGLFTDGNRWFLAGDDRLNATSQDTYELGGNSPASSAVNATYNFIRLHETVYRQIKPHLFAGAGLLFDSHTSVNPAEPQSSYITYTSEHGFTPDGQQSAGVSINVLFDSRDSQINAYRGWFANASYRTFFNGFLSGDSSWQAVHADLRHYVGLTPDARHRLAFWFYGDLVFDGFPPYFDLPTTAMDTYGRSARGYREGRFRGERLLYGEIEYRGTLTTNGLLGMVVFINTTTIADVDAGQKLFDSFAPAGGAGLRLLMNKRSRTNLCFDFAWGKDGSHGIYLAVQEAF